MCFIISISFQVVFVSAKVVILNLFSVERKLGIEKGSSATPTSKFRFKSLDLQIGGRDSSNRGVLGNQCARDSGSGNKS